VSQKQKSIFVDCPSLLPTLPILVTQTLLRVMREARINVLERAEVSEVQVHVAASASQICLDVTDNGRGFELAGASREGHRGIEIVHERAAAASSLLTITSAEGSGTRLRLRLPYREEERDR
jgi:signal transduction histidine kinase